MFDPLVVPDALLGFVLLTLVTRTTVATIRALRLRQRNRRWVRTLPTRPACCPDMAGRVGVPTTAGSAMPVLAESAVFNGERRHIQL
jgi:hypothetical protein